MPKPAARLIAAHRLRRRPAYPTRQTRLRIEDRFRSRAESAAVQAGIEPLSIESRGARVLFVGVGAQRCLAGKKQVVVLPKFALLGRATGSLGRLLGLRVDLPEREIVERQPHLAFVLLEHFFQALWAL